MKYMLLFYADAADVPETPEEQAAIQADWGALLHEAKAAGVLQSSGGLPSATTTTVRVRDGRTLTTDGPFAETHEQLGGYFLLNCEDLDEAIAWAAKVPFARAGAVEIRPLWTPDS